jgi:hypothetical protein
MKMQTKKRGSEEKEAQQENVAERQAIPPNVNLDQTDENFVVRATD